MFYRGLLTNTASTVTCLKQLLVELPGQTIRIDELCSMFLEKNCRLLNEYTSTDYRGYVLECGNNVLLHMLHVEPEDIILMDIYGYMDNFVDLLKYLGEKIGADKLGIHLIERLA